MLKKNVQTVAKYSNRASELMVGYILSYVIAVLAAMLT